MATKKTIAKVNRMVWRISDRTPQGEWIDLDAPSIDGKVRDSPEESTLSWLESTHDLLEGTDVIDDQDTVPDSLRNEFFPATDAISKRLDK